MFICCACFTKEQQSKIKELQKLKDPNVLDKVAQSVESFFNIKMKSIGPCEICNEVKECMVNG